MSSQSFENHSSRFEESTRYFMGVDLGQARDPTAIAVVRRHRVTEWYGHPKKPLERLKSEVFQVGFLERVPLGTTYPTIVGHVGRLLQRGIWINNIDLSIDKTGVGRPVADLFDAAGIEFKAVTITGGFEEIRVAHNDFRVLKMQLVSQLQALLHSGSLQIQKELIDAETLVRELQDFRVNYTDSGRMQFGAREGKHDDLVLALAIAAWDATQPDYALHSEPLRV
jgi:hypothetical protein